MTSLTPTQIAKAAVDRYRRHQTDFPRFVAELEQAVSEAVSYPQQRELRRIWGQLEIINALSLDSGHDVPSTDDEVDDLIHQFAINLPDEIAGEMNEGPA